MFMSQILPYFISVDRGLCIKIGHKKSIDFNYLIDIAEKKIA